MRKNTNGDSSLLFIIALFTVWRDALFLSAQVSPSLIPKFGDRFPYAAERLANSGLTHFLWAFGNFDGVHYLGIANWAYSDQYTQAFFPLYPVLIRIVSHLTFGNFLISALLISNLAFLAGLIIFKKLVTNFFDTKIALWSCVFLVTFPTSFYFGSVYTESIFFLLIISSFYLLSKNRVVEASIIGAAASATRLAGLFLAPSILFSTLKQKILPILIIPLGFVAYVVFLKVKFDQPLYFLTSQQIFGNERSTESIILLPQVLYRYVKILLSTTGLLFTSALLEVTAT
ncbi:MAG: mannosyltransferase family protein, partial [Candidatus Curtissbacteria bacterium]|nr:mannosyltransferase family protein [Candidatus Curtissbacteria bacterium]